MGHNQDTGESSEGMAEPTCTNLPDISTKPRFRFLSRPEAAARRRELHETAQNRSESDTNSTRDGDSTETHAGRVYFITGRKGGPFKVGWSKEPRRRLAQLQTAHWDELYIYGCVPGQRELEHEIQSELWGAHLRGEWFEREAVLRWIEAWEESPDTWGALGYEIAPIDTGPSCPERSRG